jgi:hypothetical protein
MVRIRTSQVWLGGAAIAALIATGWFVEPRTTSPRQSSGTDQEQARQAVCGDGAFPFRALSAPATAEQADDGPAAALRRLIADSTGILNYPAAGWRRLSVTANTVEFGHGEPPVLGGSVVVRSDKGSWRPERYGSSCVVRPFFNGGLAASWKLDPAVASPGPGSTSLRVLVNDSQCASGRSPEERLRRPQVRVLPDAVVVTFIADDLPGLRTCPSHAPARRTVELPERIGHRRLLDGATIPAQPPCLRIGVYDCGL